jgi:hypothetical protein
MVMQMKMIRPIILFASIFMIISIACGSSTQSAINTPAPTTKAATLAPSYTPLPTYTPRPSPTHVPTEMASPTETSTGGTSPTDQQNLTPINCVPSSTAGYNTCTDNTGNLQVDVPDYWTDVNGSTWIYNGQEIGVAISAAPDLSDFQNYYDAEGVFFGASGTFAQIIGHIELLDFYTMAYRGNCDYVGRYDYEDGIYRGKYDQYQNCGGTGGYDAYVLGARDIQDPSTKLILVEIQVYPNDTDTVEQIWGTFYVYF